METSFNINLSSRKVLLTFLETNSLVQLNEIPKGFSNNLIWNIGHIIVSQQGLVYRLSGLPMNISPEMMEKYKNGSKPTATTQEEIEELKVLLFSLLNQTKEDYANGKFTSYNEYTTGTGFHLANLKDAMEFNNYHEGIHLGFMMNIRKFI
jgi:hypothetical protein